MPYQFIAAWAFSPRWRRGSVGLMVRKWQCDIRIPSIAGITLPVERDDHVPREATYRRLLTVACVATFRCNATGVATYLAWWQDGGQHIPSRPIDATSCLWVSVSRCYSWGVGLGSNALSKMILVETAIWRLTLQARDSSAW